MSNRRSLSAAVVLAGILAIAFWFTCANAIPFHSSEVAFTDESPSGFAIVPASCPSSPNPGSCGCGPAPTVTISCDPGWTYLLGLCWNWPFSWAPNVTRSCAAPYTYDGNYCVLTGSACSSVIIGGGGGGGGCPAGDSCVPSNPPGTCPVGYTFNGSVCVFTGCTSGYTETTSGGEPACIVYCTPRDLCGSGGNLYHEDSSCTISAGPIQICNWGCTGTACNAPPAPKVVSFAVHPTLLHSGETTSVSWNVQNVTACHVSGNNGDAWTGDTGSETSGAIIAQTIYTLSCSIIPGALNADGSPAQPVNQQQIVNIVPGWTEQ